MNTPACVRRSFTLALVLSVLPSLAVTQTATRSEARIVTADELEQRAAALLDQPQRYSEAARLFKESAEMRAETDPRAVSALMKSAHLFHYANRLFDARKAMEQAAERALAGGDVVSASKARVEAALFAHKQGKTNEAERLGRSALHLAESPLLSAEQRDAIVTRLRSNPVTAALVD